MVLTTKITQNSWCFIFPCNHKKKYKKKFISSLTDCVWDEFSLFFIWLFVWPTQRESLNIKLYFLEPLSHRSIKTIFFFLIRCYFVDNKEFFVFLRCFSMFEIHIVFSNNNSMLFYVFHVFLCFPCFSHLITSFSMFFHIFPLTTIKEIFA